MKDEKKQIALALIGQPGVGKSTIVRLIDETVESRGTTYVIETDAVRYTFWELQTSSYEPERLSIFSTSFLNESIPYNRYLLIVTNSTQEDVNQLKYSKRYLRSLFPKTKFGIIANMQDLKDRLNRTRIEKMTSLPTLEISAINESHRSRLINFISYLINSESGL
ncbi:MAG: GTPase domain-containing protein [Candidatus Thorarchaeota archaeon]|nr:GTPase domain-containing protein [Candidatus Thorarchaeota archaeon]